MQRTALVVDDAATVRMYHVALLGDAGFTASQAADGYEALELAIGQRFDLMLVDVNMPRMDGYALVAAVRRDGPNSATPIVMISTEDAAPDAAAAYAAGANVYLPKPVAGEELRTLARLLTGAA
jgi:two-component system chemotaxis response regulator CheY